MSEVHGMGLLQGPRRRQFLMSEGPLYELRARNSHLCLSRDRFETLGVYSGRESTLDRFMKSAVSAEWRHPR